MTIPLKPSFILLIIVIYGLTACSSQSNSPNIPTKPSPIVNNDTKQIKHLLHSFFEAYQSEINKSNRRLKTFISHPRAFQKRYFETLDNEEIKAFGHLHPEFLSQLKVALYSCDFDPANLQEARACSEPVFQTGQQSSSLAIVAVDAEEDEAVVHTHLSENPSGKVIFTLQRIDGKWMIMERETSYPTKQKFALPIESWGVYKHAQETNQSYQIFKRNGQLTLEYCVRSDCQVKGVIIGSTTSEAGTTLKLKDMPTGELVPNWTIKGNSLTVFDYSVEQDKWIEATYLLQTSKG